MDEKVVVNLKTEGWVVTLTVLVDEEKEEHKDIDVLLPLDLIDVAGQLGVREMADVANLLKYKSSITRVSALGSEWLCAKDTYVANCDIFGLNHLYLYYLSLPQQKQGVVKELANEYLEYSLYEVIHFDGLADIKVYYDMDLYQAAVKAVNDGLFGNLPDVIKDNIDYDNLAYDLRDSYGFLEIDGAVIQQRR